MLYDKDIVDEEVFLTWEKDSTLASEFAGKVGAPLAFLCGCDALLPSFAHGARLTRLRVSHFCLLLPRNPR